MAPRENTPDDDDAEIVAVAPFSIDRAVKISIIGSFMIMAFAVLYFAQSLLLPVVLGFLLALIFSPVVRTLQRYGVPEVVSAVVVVATIGISVAGGAISMSGPIAQWVDDIPRIGFELKSKLASLREPVEKLKQAEQQVEEATGEASDRNVQQVVVKEPGLISRAASGAPDIIAGVGLTLVLLMFLLASGDMFYEKLVRVLPTLTDKKRGLTIAKAVEREVSRYLLTITGINAGLALAIGIAFHFIGMPNPVLWGTLAGLLNFIPYVGALVGVVVAAMVAIISFPTLGEAAIAPAIYLAFTMLEGQFITPVLVGRRLQVNAISVLLSVSLWGWLWGFAGTLIAVPVLIVVKVFALHVEGLGGLLEFLSPRHSDPVEKE